MPSCNKERTGITFGDYTGMIVTPYDTVSAQHTITDFTDQWGYLVDLNGDGENNIRLYTSVSVHGLSVSAIHCIDDDLTQIVCKKRETKVSSLRYNIQANRGYNTCYHYRDLCFP